MEVGVESFGEVQGEGSQGWFPAVDELSFHESSGGLFGGGRVRCAAVPLGSFAGAFGGSLVLHVHDRQPEELDGSVVGGEMPTIFDDLAELVVQALDAVGGVDQFAYGGRERQEGGEALPGVGEDLDAGRVAPSQRAVPELEQRGFGGFGAGGGVDRPKGGGEPLRSL